MPTSKFWSFLAKKHGLTPWKKSIFGRNTNILLRKNICISSKKLFFRFWTSQVENILHYTIVMGTYADGKYCIYFIVLY